MPLDIDLQSTCGPWLLNYAIRSNFLLPPLHVLYLDFHAITAWRILAWHNTKMTMERRDY